MRISADKDDPDYSPRSKLASVYLDGNKLDRCISADSVAGEAVCVKVDDKGRITIRLVDGEPTIDTEIIRGNVEIVFAE